MLKKCVGKRIKEYRTAKQLTQEELAESINITPHYLSAIERGVNQVRLEKLVEIINELGCTADDLLVDVIHNGYEKKKTILRYWVHPVIGWRRRWKHRHWDVLTLRRGMYLRQTAKKVCLAEVLNFCERYVLLWIFPCMELAGLMLETLLWYVLQEPAERV